MSDLSEAFQCLRPMNDSNFNYENEIKKIDMNKQKFYRDSKNRINRQYSPVQVAYDRVKITDPKYDHIDWDTNKPFFGFICKVCNGCVGYHFSIQNDFSHNFENGEYRELLPFEKGPFINGTPMIN